MKRRSTSAWPWLSLGLQGAKLMTEAQQVIALRLRYLTSGTPAAQRERTRMVTEKVKALGDAQRLMLGAVSRGKAGSGASSVLSLYRKKVGANRRRLSKKG